MKWHDNGIAGLTFDDVLLRLSYSTLDSRGDCNYMQRLGRDIIEYAPIVVANMRATATAVMAERLQTFGIVVPAHRFQSIHEEAATMAGIVMESPMRAASIGLNDRDRTEYLASRCSWLFLELAHAHMKRAEDEVKRLRKLYPIHHIVVGNVATADATKCMFDAGASMVKVGIGPGSVCTTRIVTGVGVPQLSAVLECAPIGPVIADGGIRNSGDIVKALAAGAVQVMIGSLFAGTDEAAGERLEGTGEKIYYGSASADGGRTGPTNIPEGVTATVPYAGSAVKVADRLLKGIRQGMAMVGARTLHELREKAVFQRVSGATQIENQPHIQFRRR